MDCKCNGRWPSAIAKLQLQMDKAKVGSLFLPWQTAKAKVKSDVMGRGSCAMVGPTTPKR